MSDYRIVFYDFVDDYLERRAPLRESHLALVRAAHERGELVLAGALADPADRGVLVWKAPRSVVSAFVEADPYVAAGLVTIWRAERWNLV